MNKRFIFLLFGLLSCTTPQAAPAQRLPHTFALGTNEFFLDGKPFEMLGQTHGLMLYRAKLVGRKSGLLVLRDLHDYGLMFVDGNLGRYWNLGPQQRLYCPAGWLRGGTNEILVLDLHQIEPKPISGSPNLSD